MNTKAQKAPTTSGAAQPLFYKNPVPLLLDRHAEAGLDSEINYNFAKDTNSVPINVTEFAEACKHYPIVFTGDNTAQPVAIVGVETQKNLFVNPTGEWKKDVYIPAYARRYPFAFSSAPGNENSLVLCIDEASSRYTAKAKKKDMRLFDGKEQTPLTKNALAFCTQFHNDQQLTRQFSKSLAESGLLTDRQVNVRLANGKTLTLGGFQTVDETKFLNLDEKLVKEWHKSGLLALINFHFLSTTNWPKLADKIAKPTSGANKKK